MTTLPSDTMLLNLKMLGPRYVMLTEVELEWPPPERLYLCRIDEIQVGDPPVRAARDDDNEIGVMRRVRMSQLDDETAAEMSNVARCAEYEYVELHSGRWTDGRP